MSTTRAARPPVPPHPEPEEVRLLRLRVWAAAVRDRQAPHQGVTAEASRLAGLLCQVLDLRTRMEARNTRAGLADTAWLLAEQLEAAGVSSPE